MIQKNPDNSKAKRELNRIMEFDTLDKFIKDMFENNI